MVQAICAEMELQRLYLGNEVVDTIYFGGGTPSILNLGELELLLTTVYNSYNIAGAPEITLEANPDDLKGQKLKDLLALGINRLSIGIQTFHNQLLSFLNRAHTSEQAVEAYTQARDAGFENISIDLIFAIPGQSKKMVSTDLDRAIALSPEHISVYSLTIEDKTVFGNWFKKGKLPVSTDEAAAEQFELIMNKLAASGFDQYEISNFCRDDYYSRHNASYWKDIPYLGVGPGAHSYNGLNRQYNIAQNHAYMKSIEQGFVPFELDELDFKSKSNEYLLTSLRTKWGCNLAKLKKDYHYDLKDAPHQKMQKFIDRGLLILDGDILLLTKKGKFVADTIIGDLFMD